MNIFSRISMSKKNDNWFLGVDLGTGSCKAVVINERAEVLGFGSGDYSGITTHEKWEEQDPRTLLDGMIRAVRSAIADAGDLKGNCGGMSMGGALHSIMAVDGSGEPLTGVITWADNRATRQAADIRETPSYASDLYNQTGCPVHAIYPAYKIRWIKENRPEVFKRTTKFISAKEYIFFRLTGQYAVDYCLAAGSGLLNTHTLAWNASSLELAGIDGSKLSPLCDPREVFYGLNPSSAEQMGVSPDTHIVLGSGDAANSSIGAGSVSPWQATCMVGTSGALRMIRSEPFLDTHSRTWCYAIDRSHWLAGGAINNGGVALSWFKDLLLEAFPDHQQGRQMTFDDMVSLAARADAGSDGIVCLPFFAGERSLYWNLNARAAFFGLTLNHKAEHVARAILEGIAFRIKSIYDVLISTDMDIRQILASGGFTHSRLWLRIVAGVLNRELVIPRWGETSCFGAAFWSLLGAGVYSDMEQIGDLLPEGEICLPPKEDVEIYAGSYKVYTDLYKALSPFFNKTIPCRAVPK
jgi:gluconokinase